MNGASADLALERRLGTVLNVGNGVSTVLLAAGLVAFFVSPDRRLTDDLLNGGLVLLMATPVGRVVAATIGFLMNRNWFFAALTFMVLSVLMAGVWVAVRAQ